MNKGLLGKVSLSSVILLAVALILIFVLPVFSIPFTSIVSPNNTAASATNQILNFTIVNTNATGNITQVNIALPAGFGFIAASNTTTASNTSFSNTTNLVSWSNITFKGFVTNGSTQYFSINVSVPSVASAAYNFNVSTLDTQTGVYNSTNVVVTVNDTTYPTWSMNQSSTPSSYSTSTLSQFNVTWSDNVNISKVFITIRNSTGVLINNVSMSNTYGDGVYNYSLVLPAGTFNWTSYANDTSNNWNASDTWTFTIGNGTVPLILSNNTSLSVAYPTSTNITGSGCPSGLTCTLYRNDTGNLSSASDLAQPGVGVYNYTYNTTGNQNYSSNSTSIVLTISIGTPDAEAFINNNNANQTIVYPNTATIKGNSSSSGVLPSFNLYVLNATSNASVSNNTSSSPVLLSSLLLGNGTYQIVFNNTANSNWTTAISNTLFLFVNKGVLSISINGSNVTYPNSVLINGTRGSNSVDSDVNYTLWRNSTLVASGFNTSGNLSDTSQLGTGWYVYTYNATGGNNWTANSTGVTLNINVSKGTLSLSLSVPGVSYPSNTVATVTASNSGASDVNYTLYRNNTGLVNFSTNGTAPAGETVFLGIGSYLYALNTSSGPFANWTANTTGINTTVTVSQGTASVTLYLNGSTSNQTSTYPNSTINVTAVSNIAGLNVTILRNGVLLQNTTTVATDITQWEVSNNTFTAQVLGNANYSSSAATTLWWNVSKGTLSLSLSVPGVSYPSNTVATVTASNSGASDVNYTLYRNNTGLVNFSTNGTAPAGETVFLGIGSYLYALNTSSGPFANWTANTTGINTTITVSKGNPTSTMNISINGTSADSTLIYPNATNVTGWSTIIGQSNLNFTLYRNSTNISNVNSTPYTIADQNFFGVNVYTYIFNTSGNANYTNGTVTRTLTISQGTPSLSLSSNSWTVTYPASSTVLCIASSQNNEVNASLFRDGNNVTSTENNTAASLAVGTYNYTCNSSATTNYSAGQAVPQLLTVSQASSTSTGGSSLGGFSTTGMVSYITLAVGKANITVNYLTTSGKLIANIARYQDVAFRGMNVTVVNNVANIKIMISKLPSLPSSVSYDISGKVYNYISVGEQNFTDADIKSVNISFAVNKTWLTNNNVDASNITLYRWANNKWNDLNAVKVSDNGNEVFFIVSSPGLSVFVIGTKGGAPVITPTQPTTCTESWSCTDWSTCTNSQQTRTCTDTNNCGTTTNKPSESQSCTVSTTTGTTVEAPVQTSMLTMVIVIVIAIIACVFIFLERTNISSYLKKYSKKTNNHKNTSYLDILARKANKIEEEEEEKFTDI